MATWAKKRSLKDSFTQGHRGGHGKKRQQSSLSRCLIRWLRTSRKREVMSFARRALSRYVTFFLSSYSAQPHITISRGRWSGPQVKKKKEGGRRSVRSCLRQSTLAFFSFLTGVVGWLVGSLGLGLTVAGTHKGTRGSWITSGPETSERVRRRQKSTPKKVREYGSCTHGMVSYGLSHSWKKENIFVWIKKRGLRISHPEIFLRGYALPVSEFMPSYARSSRTQAFVGSPPNRKRTHSSSFVRWKMNGRTGEIERERERDKKCRQCLERVFRASMVSSKDRICIGREIGMWKLNEFVV